MLEGATRPQRRWLPFAFNPRVQHVSVASRLAEVSLTLAQATWLTLLVALPGAINPRGALAVEPEKASVLRVGALVLGAAWLAARLLEPASAKPIARGSPNAAAGAWLLAAALSTALSVNPSLSFFGSYDREMGFLTLAAGPVLLVVGASLLTDAAMRERSVVALLIGSAVPCAYALVQQAGRDPLGWSGVVGIVSTFGSPTFLGGYLVLVVPFAAYRLVVDGRRVAESSGWRPVARYAPTLALLLLMLAVLFQIAIRGPMVGLAASAVAFALLVVRPTARRPLALTVVGLAGLGLLSLVLARMARLDFALFERFAQVASPAGSAAERLTVWQAAAPLPLVSPLRALVGFGPETQSAVFEQSAAIVAISPSQQFDRAHDVFVDAWLTGGLVGLAALLALLAVGFWTTWRTYRAANRENAVLPAALIAALVGHVVEQAFAFPTVVTGAWLWVVLAFVTAVGEPRRATEPLPAARSRPLAAGLVVTLALVGAPVLAGPAIADGLHGRALAAERVGDRRAAAGHAEAAAAWQPSAEELSRIAGIDWQVEGLRASGATADALLQRAADDFGEAVRRAPGDPYAHARLARHYFVWARHGPTTISAADLMQKARAACEQALIVGPHRPAIRTACRDVLSEGGG